MDSMEQSTFSGSMEQSTFEEIVLTQFYSFFSSQCKFEEKIDIRKRIRECLKSCIPRQNKTKEGLDKRHSKANEVFALQSCLEHAPSPKQNLERTSGIKGVTKSTKVMNEAYHKDAKYLFYETGVLTKKHSFNESDWLCFNDQQLSHDEFLKFIREQLSLKGLTELRSTQPLTTFPQDTDREDREKIRNIISLALRVVLERTYNEMAFEGKRNNAEQNHLEAIAEFAIYTAILDAIYHKQYKTCGIAAAGDLC